MFVSASGHIFYVEANIQQTVLQYKKNYNKKTLSVRNGRTDKVNDQHKFAPDPCFPLASDPKKFVRRDINSQYQLGSAIFIRSYKNF